VHVVECDRVRRLLEPPIFEWLRQVLLPEFGCNMARDPVYCGLLRWGTGDVYNEECVPAADAYMQCDNEFYDLTVVQKQYPNHVSALCMGTPTVSYSTNRCQMANVQGDTCNN